MSKWHCLNWLCDRAQVVILNACAKSLQMDSQSRDIRGQIKMLITNSLEPKAQAWATASGLSHSLSQQAMIIDSFWTAAWPQTALNHNRLGCTLTINITWAQIQSGDFASQSEWRLHKTKCLSLSTSHIKNVFMSSSYNMEVTIDQCWEMNLTSTLQRKPTTYQCMTTNIENQSTRQHNTEFQWTGMSLRDEHNTDNQSTHEMKTDTSQSICFVSRDHNPHHGHHQRNIPCTVTLHSQWRCSAGSSRGCLEDLRPRS